MLPCCHVFCWFFILFIFLTETCHVFCFCFVFFPAEYMAVAPCWRRSVSICGAPAKSQAAALADSDSRLLPHCQLRLPLLHRVVPCALGRATYKKTPNACISSFHSFQSRAAAHPGGEVAEVLPVLRSVGPPKRRRVEHAPRIARGVTLRAAPAPAIQSSGRSIVGALQVGLHLESIPKNPEIRWPWVAKSYPQRTSQSNH